MTNQTLAVCSRCGRVIPVSESGEAGLIAAGAMVEFYYCADRTACDAARRARAEATLSRPHGV
jgi:hypothetical protein